MKEVLPTLLSPTINTLKLFDPTSAPLESPAEWKTKVLVCKQLPSTVTLTSEFKN